MANDRISVRVDPKLRKGLARLARVKKRKESELVREALERLVELGTARPAAREPKKRKPTCLDLLNEIGFIGSAGPGLPPDLSTNRKYMEGFGE